jgi:hypothetical protein
LAVVAAILGSAAATSTAENQGYNRLAEGSWEGEALRDAVRGAQRRLANPACQQILSDFSDASGRTLRANLDALGQTPEGYLDLLLFYDAAGSGRCTNPYVLAMTATGSRVIFVCAEQFANKRRTHQRQTEIALIHEALHSLGLGENPPSASAITAQVMKRCR